MIYGSFLTDSAPQGALFNYEAVDLNWPEANPGSNQANRTLTDRPTGQQSIGQGPKVNQGAQPDP